MLLSIHPNIGGPGRGMTPEPLIIRMRFGPVAAGVPGQIYAVNTDGSAGGSLLNKLGADDHSMTYMGNISARQARYGLIGILLEPASQGEFADFLFAGLVGDGAADNTHPGDGVFAARTGSTDAILAEGIGLCAVPTATAITLVAELDASAGEKIVALNMINHTTIGAIDDSGPEKTAALFDGVAGFGCAADQ